MFGMSAKEIQQATGARLIQAGAAGSFTQPLRAGAGFTGISTDTRRIAVGDLFIALKGDNFNGHDFIGEAVTKGAKGAMVSVEPARFNIAQNRNFIIFKVRDTLKAYGDIARRHRERFDIPFIGITGSTGKTTAKEMVYEVLSSQFMTLKNEGTENNLVGLPRTLLRLESRHNIAVLELGSNHFGEIHSLAEILKPTIGIITNIGPSHLEFLKSEKRVLREKTYLLKALDKSGTALINTDDKLISKIKGLKCNIIRFGIDTACDFKASKIIQEKGRMRFSVNDRYDFQMRLLGRHNVYNALIAISTGFLRGVSFENIHDAILRFRPIDKRLCIKTIGGVDFIDDTYNSNPQSINAAIQVLSDYKTAGRKILVCADMLELGKNAIKFHIEIGRSAHKMGLDQVVCVGDFSAAVKEGAVQAGMSERNIFSCKDSAEASAALKGILEEGDVLLFKGSRRMKMEEVLDAVSSFVSPKRNMVRV